MSKYYGLSEGQARGIVSFALWPMNDASQLPYGGDSNGGRSGQANVKYDYIHLNSAVADGGIDNRLNYYGNQGWKIIKMEVVDWYSGTANFLFKRIRSTGSRGGTGNLDTLRRNVRFNYHCWPYDNFWHRQFENTLREWNDRGYDWSDSSPWNPGFSVCLMTRYIHNNRGW